MGVRTWEDYDNGHTGLFCSTSDWCFGPLFSTDENYDADSFLDWMNKEHTHVRIRMLTDSELASYYNAFMDRYIERDHIKWSEVRDVKLDQVDPNDYPDFCDAYIESAVWGGGDYEGQPLTENECQALTEQNLDKVNELAHEYYNNIESPEPESRYYSHAELAEMSHADEQNKAEREA